MKNSYAFLLFFALSCCAYSDDHEDGYDYEELEFNFSYDILYINAISNFFEKAMDMGWRALGYDSNAFIRVKKYLQDRSLRIELILATLVAEKYPAMGCTQGYASLLLEIQEGQLCEDLQDVYPWMNLIQATESFHKVFDDLKALSIKERRAVFNNLRLSEPGTSILADSDKLPTFYRCLVSLLQRHEHER